MSLFEAQDTISGKEGRAFTTINGVVEDLFYLKTLEATITKNKTVVRVVGKRNDHHKSTGWGGAGTFMIHYMTSKFRSQLNDYIKNGTDTYFDVQIVNDDPASSVGKQTTVLKNCNIDSVIAGKLDSDTDDPLDEEIPFTFEGYEVLDEFTELNV
jgi:hypothetical protein